jgi:hypothetical protein
MSRPNPDSAYRAIILAQPPVKAPLKTKIAALQAMQKPSEVFLGRLINAPDTHPKLRLLAANRLRTLQQARLIAKLNNS